MGQSGAVERPITEAKVKKRPPPGGGDIYPKTGPSHTHMDAKDGVGGVLGALGGAKDPVKRLYLQTGPAPCLGKTISNFRGKSKEPSFSPQGHWKLNSLAHGGIGNSTA